MRALREKEGLRGRESWGKWERESFLQVESGETLLLMHKEKRDVRVIWGEEHLHLGERGACGSPRGCHQRARPQQVPRRSSEVFVLVKATHSPLLQKPWSPAVLAMRSASFAISPGMRREGEEWKGEERWRGQG